MSDTAADDAARLVAYYYSFEPTGVPAIDKILSAVADAGKAHHHTDSWDEEPAYDGGPSFAARIQTAANEAAGAALRAAEQTQKALRAASPDTAELARRIAALEYACDADAEMPEAAEMLANNIAAALLAHTAALTENYHAADEALQQIIYPVHPEWSTSPEMRPRQAVECVTALVAERDALRTTLTDIETILLPHAQTNVLSSDGKRIMEILRAALRQG